MWELVDDCVRALIAAAGADLLRRLYLALREYVYCEKYYLPERRLWTVLERAFTYKRSAQWLLFALVAVALVRRPEPSLSMALLMPFYWIFQAAGVSHSTLDYAHWIRESHGLDYAAGMASNYFHGYLNLSLPARNGNGGLRKRMQIYEDQKKVTFGIDRLIILIPDEMFVNGVIESELLEKVLPLETVNIDRAGVNRPFKHAVYRLTQPINGIHYFFAMEGATPMLSFFDAMNHSLSSTWQMKELKREIWLKFYKHLKELLSTWPETRSEVELIIYNSHKTNGERVDVGELIKTHFELKNIKAEPKRDESKE